VTLAVTVLGCAGMFATAERACSGYLLEIDDRRLWLDAGAGTWQRLLRHIHYRDLGGIMLTHRHPDHTSDFFMAFHARDFGEAQPLPRIPLWAPQETLDALCSFDSSLGDAFELRALAAGDSISIFGARFSFVAMSHPPETLGVRVEHGGKVLAYSADTGPGADFDRLAARADLFLCEATLEGDREWEGHLNAAQAKAAAERVGVRRLMLTHLPPERDPSATLSEVGPVADGLEVDLASEDRRVEV
jgi:ribonuclease BN (tRNA processing enzyme)